MKTNERISCKDCVNFDGIICDYNGLLCYEDDDPRCNGEGFEGERKNGKDNKGKDERYSS